MIYNRPGLRLVIRIVLLAVEIFIASYLIISTQFLFGGIVLLVAVYQSYNLYEFLKKAQAEVQHVHVVTLVRLYRTHSGFVLREIGVEEISGIVLHLENGSQTE